MEKLVRTKHGLEAKVSHFVKRESSGLHVIELHVTCGGTTGKHTITMGADDGPRTHTPTTVALQAQLDKTRKAMADEAAWKESVRIALKGVE